MLSLSRIDIKTSNDPSSCHKQPAMFRKLVSAVVFYQQILRCYIVDNILFVRHLFSSCPIYLTANTKISRGAKSISSMQILYVDRST